MGVLGKRLKIVMVPVPTLSGPTSGTFKVQGGWHSYLMEDDLPRPGAGGGAVGVGGAGQEVDHRGRGGDHHHHKHHHH